MGIALRPYQADIIAAASTALARNPRVLIQAPTGAGKTALAAHMVGGAAAKGKRVVFLVHRTELLTQASAAFTRQGIDHGRIAAGEAFNPHHRVYVASIGTVARRLDRMPAIDLAVVDECHHSAAASWSKVLDALNPRWTIGLSATPCRLDGRGLDAHYDALVPGPAVADLIEAGFLSPFRVFAPTTLDMTGARTVAGDYNRKDAAAAADKPAIIGDVVAHYQRLVPGKRAVAFCVSIEHARHVAATFASAGIAAEAIDGGMMPAERAAALHRFERGQTLVLASVDLVSEGFDLPAIEAALLLRPTKSLSLYLQQVGRVLRPSPGKAEAIILDHVGSCAVHGFPDDARDWSLEGVVKRKRKAGDANPVRTCEACFRVYRPAPRCPACGHAAASAAREVEHRDGELGEVVRPTVDQRKALVALEARTATTLADWQAIARKAGYAPGWAFHRFQARQVRA